MLQKVIKGKKTVFECMLPQYEGCASSLWHPDHGRTCIANINRYEKLRAKIEKRAEREAEIKEKKKFESIVENKVLISEA